jgi:hypothetical protein
MTSEHRVRRILARVCSPETMSRVVDPTLGDIRFEDGRLSWRGCLALARALIVHVVSSLPSALSRVYRDDDRAMPRAAVAGAVTVVVLVAPLVAIPAQSALRLSWRAVLFLVPQALAVALPPSLLVAIPLAFRHATSRRRLVAQGLTLSLLCAAATIAVITRLVPDANQGFRVEAVKRVGEGRVHLDRGPMEMTQRELRERIEVVRLTPGGVPVARQLEYVYQMKYALGTMAVPLGVLGIALVMSRRGRRRPILLGALCIIAYTVVIFPIVSATGLLTVRFAIVPPGVFAWMPAAILAAIVGLAVRRATRHPRAISA